MTSGTTILRVASWALIVMSIWIGVIVTVGAARARAELDTRKECFASNERMAKTLANSQHMPMQLNSCNWR